MSRRLRTDGSLFIFAMVGALGTGAQYAVLILLVHTGVADPVTASTIGAVVGAATNFFLNHHVTFKADVPMLVTGPRYAALVLLSIVSNAALIFFMIEFLHFGYLVAQIIATGFVFLTNFGLSKVWVFANRNPEIRP